VHELLLCLAFAWFCLAWIPCDGCSRPTCDCCAGRTARAFKCVVAGIADQNCTDCDDYNATYIVPWIASSASLCKFGLVLPAASNPCNPTKGLSYNLNIYAPVSDCTFEHTLFIGSGTDTIWIISQAGAFDCRDWVDEPITLAVARMATICDDSAATCVATSL
jgi:hypothetical protein